METAVRQTMNSISFLWVVWTIGFNLLGSHIAQAAFPQAWKNVQEVRVEQAGLVRINLPLATIDAARPGLEDLRLVDASGHEIPYLVERPVLSQAQTWPVGDFRVVVDTKSTVDRPQQPLKAVTLETPAEDFIKAVQVEGSKEDGGWQLIAQGIPVYRLAKRAGRLLVEVPPSDWSHLRLTLDDQRSPPIPITGVRLHAAEAAQVPSEELPMVITERNESLQETRLTLQAAGSHVTLAGLTLETPDGLFTRAVTLSYREYAENAVRETVLATGILFRFAVEGLPTVSNLTLATEVLIPSRELFLKIDNGDNPPLQSIRIAAQRRPIYLTFLASYAGTYYCLTGNDQCVAPKYDLSAQRERLQSAELAPVQASALTINPDYRVTDSIPEVQAGRALDVSQWKYRKRLHVSESGVQQFDVDLEVLSRALSTLQDLRLICDGKQLPFVVERPAISRAFTPEVTAGDDPKRPQTSRWIIGLPLPRLPMKRLTVASGAPYFKREVRLIEETADERGVVQQRLMDRSRWVKTLEQKDAKLELNTDYRMAGNRLLLEIDNGDNPPLQLKDLKIWYPLARVLFKVADPVAEVFLYYGNQQAVVPQYDLNIIAPQLLAAAKSTAACDREEALQKQSWRDSSIIAGSAGVVFWITLILVVAGLLYVIARLLPGGNASKNKE
jgi:hypothetical protein